jgi:hypothetical protein
VSSLAPRTSKERIADEALELINRRCEEEGLNAEYAFVTFKVSQKDEDGDNAATAFATEEELGPDERNAQLFGFLVAQVKGVGKALGLTVYFGKIDGGPMS